MNSNRVETRRARQIAAQRFSAGCWGKKSRGALRAGEIACGDRAGLALRSWPEATILAEVSMRARRAVETSAVVLITWCDGAVLRCRLPRLAGPR
jgi:hypothetical protein